MKTRGCFGTRCVVLDRTFDKAPKSTFVPRDEQRVCQAATIAYTFYLEFIITKGANKIFVEVGGEFA